MAASGGSTIDIRHRLRLVGIFFVLASLVLVSRLVKIQLLNYR